jgi:alkylresorcinol/alkylpyrone synthase
MKIAAVGRALPAHRYDQAAILAYLEEVWRDRPRARLRSLFESVRVDTRHLALPLEAYARLDTFGKANDAWIRCALELGERAIGDALMQAHLSPGDVDALFTVSVTGVASPALDARLMNRMKLRTDLKRIPIFGLGCVAGAAGVARAADYVRAFPDQVALVLSVELCSLTFQRGDASMANSISSGLFGDGAAAAIVVGAERARALGVDGPAVAATRSVFYPDTEDVMGWRISENGFELVLAAGIPAIVREHAGHDVDRFLSDHGLSRADVTFWVCHPGGPKVLYALQDALDLDDAAVAPAWRILAEQGNLSSASVLMVLGEVLARPRPVGGAWGVMLAMGPAFCSELVLLRW